MTKRNTQQRRHTILSQVNELGEVAVEALAEQFQTSEVTIRKDLTALEKSGLLLRRYGGAIALPQEIVSDEEDSVRKIPTLLMTGGTWDPHSESFQGQVAENVLRSYDFDQLFIGADGIDVDRGTTTFNELVGLSQVMAESAREVVVLVESDKIGRKIPNLELPWQQITTLITDNNLSEEKREAIRKCGVQLICADIE